MKKKILTAGITAASVCLLSACGGSDPLTIYLYQENIVYNENMPVFKNANEYAGIELEGTLQKYDTNYSSIYNLRGKNCNLVVHAQEMIESSALNDGLFIDLTDLIKEHAPNLQEFFDENPTQLEMATASDGKIYGVPFYTDGSTAKGYFVRQDWVDKLAANNKLPSGVNKDNLDTLTVTQYEELLRAFKTNEKLLNPSGTVIPYFDKDNEFAISELASLWGATAEFTLDSEGNVVYGATQPEFKEAMKNMQRWYQDGLIDDQILISDSTDKRVTMFSRNQGGSTHDWIGSTDSFNRDYYAANLPDGFELTCILPPIREDGTRLEPTIRKEIGKVTAINKNTSEEDRIKLVKWIDYFFSDKGHDELNFGIEGEHFTKENGTYTYTNKILNDNGTALANLYNAGAQLQSPGVQTFDYEKAWLSPHASEKMVEYNNFVDNNYNKLIFPNMKLSNEDYKTVNTAKSQLFNEFNKQVNAWLKGESVDATWDQFVSNMNTRYGADSVCAILQNNLK